MTAYTPLLNSERRSTKKCIGLTIGGVLFSALLISSLVLNVHFFIRNDIINLKNKNIPKVVLSGSQKTIDKIVKGAAACDGTDCPAGCCTGHYDWVCCTDQVHCAATDDDCPASTIVDMASPKSMKVVKGAAACDGTECPAGCCTGHTDWVCCADQIHCAATDDDCPPCVGTECNNIAKIAKKIKGMLLQRKNH